MERPIARAALRATTSILLFIFLMLNTPACMAQYTSGHAMMNTEVADGDAFYGHQASGTWAETRQGSNPEPPCLQGATMGTIGPQGVDATYLTGVNPAGAVRVNMLSNLEALLNIVASGAEIIFVLWGGGLLVVTMMYMFRARYGLKRLIVSAGLCVSFLCTGLGILSNALNCAAFASDMPWKPKDKLQLKFWIALLLMKAGLTIPFLMNWIVAAARDADLFC
ncbi:MAG TPA: hypothetical protein PKZ32_02080 [Candidatus Melainabacteria bacterium]|nr:hypothetical protein [Candidatus Melainabacteria bacterium]